MRKSALRIVGTTLMVSLAGLCFLPPLHAQKTNDPRIGLSPGSINFGGVDVGSSKTRRVKIRNRGGADLEIGAIAVCSGTTTEFSASSAGTATLAPKGTLNLDVTYLPTDAGTDQGCLTIASNDPKNPVVEVSVRGRGVDDTPTSDEPDIDLKPDDLEFGEVAVGGSRVLLVKIRNKGATALEGVMLGWCFGTSPEFSWDPSTMFSVPPDGQVRVEITYAPTDAGRDEGCLEIVSNDPDENPVVVEVSGTGIEGTGVVDLDIHDFKVRRKVRLGSSQRVIPALWVKSAGLVDEPRWAIVVGMQGPVEVYNEELLVTDRGGNQGKTKYVFPAFTPSVGGEILWMAAIDDDDSDIDESFAVTQVIEPQTTSVDVDLDATKLKATKSVALSESRSIKLRLWVKNRGSVDEARPATLIGTQGVVEVYNETITVSDRPGDNASTKFVLPSYSPMEAGDILWTLEIEDDDFDADVMSAVTKVVP